MGPYNANGMTCTGWLNDGCTSTDIDINVYSEVWRLCFFNLGIPAEAKLQSTSLTVYADDPDQNSPLFPSEQDLAAPWSSLDRRC